MTTRQHIDAALAVCDKAGVQPHELAADKDGVTVEFSTCGAYVAACHAANATTGSGYLVKRDNFRMCNAHVGDLVLRHRCWPHLPCWGTDLRKVEPTQADLFGGDA